MKDKFQFSHSTNNIRQNYHSNPYIENTTELGSDQLHVYSGKPSKEKLSRFGTKREFR